MEPLLITVKLSLKLYTNSFLNKGIQGKSKKDIKIYSTIIIGGKKGFDYDCNTLISLRSIHL